MEYDIKIKDNAIKIYFNGYIHVAIKQKDIKGFQSWIMGDENKKYCIEFYIDKVSILTEYDERDKWETILKLLDNSEIFQIRF